MEFTVARWKREGAGNKSLWFDDRLRKFAFLLWRRDVDGKTETNLRAAGEYLIANTERKLALGQTTRTVAFFVRNSHFISLFTFDVCTWAANPPNERLSTDK